MVRKRGAKRSKRKQPQRRSRRKQRDDRDQSRKRSYRDILEGQDEETGRSRGRDLLTRATEFGERAVEDIERLQETALRTQQSLERVRRPAAARRRMPSRELDAIVMRFCRALDDKTIRQVQSFIQFAEDEGLLDMGANTEDVFLLCDTFLQNMR